MTFERRRCERSKRRRMEERQPLAGLAVGKPVRFLRALVLAEKQRKPVTEAWETFLNSEARQRDQPRLMWAIARRAAQLPPDVLAQLARPVSDWILRVATPLQKEPRKPFEALWSALLPALREHPEATASGLLSSGIRRRLLQVRFGRPGRALNRPTWSPVKGSSASVSPNRLSYGCPTTIFLDPRNRHRHHLSATLLDRRPGNGWARLLRCGRDRSGGGFPNAGYGPHPSCGDCPIPR